MSYDIAVFATETVDDDGFEAWFEEQAEWGEDHDYTDPAVTSVALRRFYEALAQEFPPMNGPDADADEDVDDPRLADYSIGRELLYVAFGWSQARAAQAACLRIAAATGVAVGLVSDDGRIVRPDVAPEQVGS
jgi:hypothetical protein